MDHTGGTIRCQEVVTGTTGMAMLEAANTPPHPIFKSLLLPSVKNFYRKKLIVQEEPNSLSHYLGGISKAFSDIHVKKSKFRLFYT